MKRHCKTPKSKTHHASRIHSFIHSFSKWFKVTSHASTVTKWSVEFPKGSSSKSTTSFYNFKPNEPPDQFPVQVEAFILDGLYPSSTARTPREPELPVRCFCTLSLTVICLQIITIRKFISGLSKCTLRAEALWDVRTGLSAGFSDCARVCVTSEAPLVIKTYSQSQICGSRHGSCSDLSLPRCSLKIRSVKDMKIREKHL